MDKIIDLNAYPVRNLLKLLLKDKTTKQNIIFATSAYSTDGNPIKETDQMTETILRGFNSCEIQPRVLKSQEQQQERTKAKAEVFTPSWICNKMNNHCDEEWFGRTGIFNIELENGWMVTNSPVPFEHEGDWMKYIDSKRLEITCGEAPYIVSRYDAATGELIEIGKRIGILDRKLRVVNENTDNESDWFKWVLRAYQSVYGYEFQGDNLLIARINLLVTFVDYMQDRWGRVPTDTELRKIANVIVWNLWQMDGMTGTVPFGKPKEQYHQYSLFDFVVVDEANDVEKQPDMECRIYDWRSDRSLTYRSIKEGY
ncbi:MAG: restriction endonuclease subunit M [Roseburia sp.]